MIFDNLRDPMLCLAFPFIHGDWMIEVIDLKKKFGFRPALQGVGFKLNKGEIYGLLGPNGAGKTTTLKILAGLISHDEGIININGKRYNWASRELKRLIAYVPDQPFLYAKLTGEEHMHFYADLYEIPEVDRDEKFDFYFKYFEFEAYKKELIESYSAGTRQKLVISQALMVNPKIILLDEPLVSIDPLVGRKFKNLLREISKKGTIALFATHILSLAQEISTRIGIIIDGKIRVEGSISELVNLSKNENLEDFYYRTVMEYDWSHKS
jgi:ABC-2 type transport system ATP-binding protein